MPNSSFGIPTKLGDSLMDRNECFCFPRVELDGSRRRERRVNERESWRLAWHHVTQTGTPTTTTGEGTVGRAKECARRRRVVNFDTFLPSFVARGGARGER